ncbi:MAG: histidine kinase [Acidimicrobiales bacterium]
MDESAPLTHHQGVTQGTGEDRDRRLARLAVGLFGLTMAMAVAMLVLAVAASGSDRPPEEGSAESVVFIAAGLATPSLGALLAVRRPANPIGWLFLAGGLAGVYSGFAWGYGYQGLVADPGSLPMADWVLWTGALGFAAFFLPGVFALLLFPNGRLLSPRWRLVLWIAVGWMAIELASTLVTPGPIPDFDDADIPNPAGIEDLEAPIDAVTAVTGSLGAVVLPAAVLAALVLRYRRGDRLQRQQLAFFGATVVVFVGLVIVTNTVGGGYGENEVLSVLTDFVLLAGLPAALAASILWRGLYDIERVMRRTVVYWTLWAAVVAMCGVGAWVIGLQLADRVSVGAAVLGTVVATMLFEPVRRALSRLADRLVFGPSNRGYELAADFGATVDRAGDVGELAGRLAELVCRGLDTRWARATLRVGSLDEAVGECTAPRVQRADGEAVISVPIAHRDEQLGVVECGAKLEGAFGDADRRLLELLAKEVALAAHALGLATSLAASRSRLVTAQEAERRRIERNIHDGAQQQLVALIIKVRLARDLLARDADAAVRTLEEVQGDARTALREIRELAQGIHPTVLGDQGVVHAIEDRTSRLPIDVRVNCDAVTRRARYDDAVEGTAFFVVSEALANVLKHAGAEHASIGLSQHNGTLDVRVEDDGCGFVLANASGTGLVALTDRVEALGGRLDIDSTPGRGTVVRARLPVRYRAAAND